VTPVLACENLLGGYGDLPVVHDVSVVVRPGEFVGLIGRNGVGKSTLLKLLLGRPQAYAPAYPRRFAGRVLWDGADVSDEPLYRAARRGVAYVPEQGGVFRPLTVAENLRVGSGSAADLDWVYDLFPVLAERARVRAGALSGGEQRMLLVARALLARPRVLLVDEVSIGLQPSVIETVVGALRRLRDEHQLAVLLVEQRVTLALAVTDRVYALDKGRVVLDARTEPLRADPSPLAGHLVV